MNDDLISRQEVVMPTAVGTMINAFREVTFSATVTKEEMTRFLNIMAPKYILTELKFPRKKKRGTMRRRRNSERFNSQNS